MPDEIIKIYDQNNNYIGRQKTKLEAHQQGLWHRTAHVWIYNSQKEILLQLRSKQKKLYPNLWDVTAAGHIEASEEPIEAAIRETKEELGLNIKKENLNFFKIINNQAAYDTMKDNHFSYAFLLKYDGNIKKLKLQKQEVEAIKLIPIRKLEKDLKTNPQKYTPRGQYWVDIIDKIKNLT